MVEIRNEKGEIVGYESEDINKNASEIMMLKFDSRLSRVESKLEDLYALYTATDKKLDASSNKLGTIINYMYDAMSSTVKINVLEKTVCDELRPAIKENAMAIGKINAVIKFSSWLFGAVCLIISLIFGYTKLRQ